MQSRDGPLLANYPNGSEAIYFNKPHVFLKEANISEQQAEKRQASFHSAAKTSVVLYFLI